jgi:hypothetical protein
MKNWHIVVVVTIALHASLGHADTIDILPSQIGQLTENPSGGGGNMAGLFAGQSGMVGLRRGLLEFNIAGSIPAGSTIDSATLVMNLLSAGSGPSDGLRQLVQCDHQLESFRYMDYSMVDAWR